MTLPSLAPYQQEAHDFLLTHQRAALFMGLGLGKTATTIAALHSGLLLGQINAALVVAPLRVCNLTWPAELEKWGFPFRVASLRRPEGWYALAKGEAQVYLINYEALPKLVEHHLARNLRPAFDCVVFDELTRAKNHNSKRINALRRRLGAVPTRWGLTGTPTPNSYMELFAQIRLLDDGKRLGPAFEAFKRTYFEATDYMEYDWKPKAGSKEAIQKRIADMTLTMRTTDYLDLPEMTEHDVEVSMPPEARKLYEYAEKEALLQLEKGDVVIANAAVLAGKLLQIASGAVYDADSMAAPLHDAKVQALRPLLRSGPLMVACNYVHERTRIRAAYPQAVDFADAKTDRQQVALAEQWNAGKVPLLMADPRSIGHGLNLQHGGCRVCWFSPTYSRELYDQMNARLFRRGQTDPVQVYRLLCNNSIDDAVVETLRNRGEDQQALLAALRNLQLMRK